MEERIRVKKGESTIFSKYSGSEVFVSGGGGVVEKGVGMPGFSLHIDPGDATEEELADLLTALSNYHQSLGGGVLHFSVDGEHLLACEEAVS